MWLSHNRARRSTYGGERAEPLLPRRPLIPAPAAPESLKDRGPVRFQMRQRPSLRLHSAVRQYVRQFSSSLNSVLPFFTTYLGPRTAWAGFTSRTWPVTSQSNSIRTAARCCLTVGGES